MECKIFVSNLIIDYLQNSDKPDCRTLDVLDKLRVEEGEAGELLLVQVHHEELVGGGQLGRLVCELAVEVGHVSAAPLCSKFIGEQKLGHIC